MPTRNVTIIGNRDISRSIISALLPASPKTNGIGYEVTVLTYPSQTPYLPPQVSPNFVKHKTSDFASASLESAFSGQDIVISTVAGGEYAFQARIIDAAVAARVKRFVPHEFGHDSWNERIQARLPSSAERAKVIEYLHRQASINAQFEWAAVALGCMLDSKLRSGDLGFDLQWRSATVHGTGTEVFAASSIGRVGLAVASLIRQWDGVKNSYLYAAGVLTTADDIVACLRTATGSDWSVDHADVEECTREGHSRIDRGFPDSGLFLLERSVIYDEKLSASEAFRYRSANDMLQLEPETLQSIVDEAYHEFQHRGKVACGCS
ncbi:isoflavone reductase family protein [Lophiotrema nucula]|uniref:Isoflavone reductase family protein n=1 Tax=Lophiotrema nucula TaxID=690887 RepID=A0A6A5Z527_9PLEO|nr:isoflavone reductase family protein [Lophiotrema nucula]